MRVYVQCIARPIKATAKKGERLRIGARKTPGQMSRYACNARIMSAVLIKIGSGRAYNALDKGSHEGEGEAASLRHMFPRVDAAETDRKSVV